jgi:hypothetical protein
LDQLPELYISATCIRSLNLEKKKSKMMRHYLLILVIISAIFIFISDNRLIAHYQIPIGLMMLMIRLILMALLKVTNFLLILPLTRGKRLQMLRWSTL